MRTEVTIVLVICGTLLVLAPPASDYFATQQAAKLLAAQHDFQSVHFGIQPMSETYRLGCWALGAAMIFVGIVGGWFNHWVPPPGNDGSGSGSLR